ncbi:MAG: hypothetical protein ACLTT1_03405 [[Clostridium] scindens]
MELTLTDGAQPRIIFTTPHGESKELLSCFVGSRESVGPHLHPRSWLTILIIRRHVLAQEAFYHIRKAYGRASAAMLRASLLAGINVRQGICGNLHHQFPAGGAGGRHAGTPGREMRCRAAWETYLTDCCGGLHWDPVSGWNKFNIIGSAIGALFVGFISNFITLMGMGIAYKNIFNGVFIILAVALGVLKSKVNS